MADFFEILFGELAVLIQPVQDATQSGWGLNELVNPLGFDLDVITSLDLAPLQAALGAIVSAVQALETGDGPQAIADVADALGSVSSAFTAVQELLSSLEQASDLPAGLAAQMENAGADLVQQLISSYVQSHPISAGLLGALGALTNTTPSGTPITVPATGAIAYLPTATQQVDVQTILAFVRDPVGTLSSQIFGGPASALTAQQQVTALAAALGPRLQSLGIPLGRAISLGTDQRYRTMTGDLGAAGDELANSAITVPLVSDDGIGEVMLGITIVPAGGSVPRNTVVLTVEGEASETITAGAWQLTLSAAGAVRALAVDTAGQVALPSANAAGDTLTLGLALSYSPPGPPAAAPSGSAAGSSAPAVGGTSQPPALLIGAANGTRLQVSALTLGGNACFGATAAADIDIAITLTNAALVLDFSEGDGFLQQVASSVLGSPVSASADVTIGWARGRGVYLKGGGTVDNAGPAGLSAQLAANLDFGPIRIQSVTIGFAPTQAQGGEQLTLTAGVSASVTIGPVVATVTNVGLAATIDGQPGNLGALDLALGFKPPDGIGLALDAPPVAGTGFLSYSATDGRYLGAFALTAGDVAISAVGVLDTRLPGGASGYSLLIVASATVPPVELGFGFSLSGIGGLVGVNRTANVPSLQALARAGRLDDLMFPADLIHRAPQVAANLAQQFPAAQGHFIVGPAVQIEWGTGGMIYADIGVFIELTDSGGGVTVLRIALLGLVQMTLPSAAAPVADITLDVLGVLDFAAQTLSLDAGLRNSTIATFPLTGQAALRAGWGSNPEFLFAIGGFNPHFQAPAGFPALQRIGLAIGGDNPRLRLSAYLAVTSNTLQLGCAADLYAAVRVAGVTAAVQASLTFDALVQFQPFGLIVDLTIAAAILVNDNPLLSLSLALHVTGPQPWTVTGSASFQFLFISITVPISVTAGPAAPLQFPQTVDLDSNLLTALTDPHSWATGPPPGRGLVHVRSQNAAQPAMHPLGSVTVRQHAVPLAQRVERYGPDLIDAPCQYTITGTQLGGQPASSTAVTDFFAPAQFLTMTDAQKLSAPSFQTMTAGTTLGTSALTVPCAAGTVIDTQSTATWDTLILDSPDPASSGTQPAVVTSSGQATVPGTVLANQLSGAAIAVNGPSGRGQAPYAAPGSGIGVEQPTYAVVGMNLRAPGTTAAITTLRIGSIAAGQAVAAAVGDPQDTQVVYTSEVPG